ncbi:hypothetical protein FGU65_12210 [Methanoculleus sp. FWC-SCC1]|uniref:Uncharacterized protein n=1 Tax=Methanoculleus frigidifontis TaxID=2584085 RepID=A0ABT8MCI7_9EURY|nr:hypothetical protein [Methanoculleus sp. FWC-SCC1]MDN7025645.1 hypothetical protein [Methanoculleus sp. FWC-SCC1]
MAQKDARIRFLERELADREAEVETLKGAETTEISQIDDERLRDVERKIADIEALVKGLTGEMLDLKSIVMKMQRQADERGKAALPAEPRKAEMPKEPAAAEPERPVLSARRPVREGAAAKQEPPAVRAARRESERPAPEDADDLELIMQNDGTLKPERRGGSEYIVASTRYDNKPMSGGRKGSSDSLVVADSGQRRRKEADNIIHAEDDDTIEFDSKQ